MAGGGYREYDGGRRPDGRRPGGTGEYRGAGRRGRGGDRRRRRKIRLIKAAIAWAVCLLLLAGVAVGTFQLIGYVTTSKMRQYRESGLEKMEGKNYGGAIQDFDLALEKAGKRTEFKVDVLSYRAEAEYRLQDYEAALHSYDLIVELEPKRPEYRYLQSMCHSRLGNTDQAMDLYRKGVSLEKKEESSPGRELALIAAGSASVDKGEYEKAMNFYKEAIEGGVVHGQIYNQMGLCQMAEADYEGALDSFNQGYEVLVTGYSLGSGARPPQAAQALKENERADYGLLKELTYNLAVTYEYLYRYDEALALFQEYVEAFGADENAQHEIDFLRSR